MNRNDFTLGLGIGIVITTIVYFIVFNFTNVEPVSKDKQLNSPEVRPRNYSIDIVDGTDNITENNIDLDPLKDNTIESDSNRNLDVEQNNDITENNNTSNAEGSYENIDGLIYVDITPNLSATEISHLLFRAGIIQNEDDFLNYIVDNNDQRNIRYGSHYLNPNSSIEELTFELTN